MSEEEKGELVNKDEKQGVRRAVGDGMNVFQGACNKLGMCGALLCTIMFSIILGLALPIAAIAIGVIHKEDCSPQPYIPLYLIVAGAGGLVSNILGTFCRPAKEDESTPEWRRTVANKAGCCVGFLTFVNSVLGFFLLAWFIAGSVWVFGAYDSRGLCNSTVYWFAFVTIAISDAIIAVMLVGGFIACCCFCCCAICKG